MKLPASNVPYRESDLSLAEYDRTMCRIYEYDMTPELMQSLKDHLGLVGAGYLCVLRERNGPQ